MTAAIHIILAWLEFVSYSFCLAFVVLRLPAFAVVTPDAPYRHDVIGLPGRRLFGLALTAVVLITVAPFIDSLEAMKLSSQQNVFAGWSRFFRTFGGIIVAIRMASAGLLLLLLIPYIRERNAASYFMLVPAIVLGWTISASSPGPGRLPADSFLPQTVDLFHLLTASLWGGGAFALALVALPALLKQGNMAAAAETSRRYLRMTGYTALVLLITSVINLKMYVGSFSSLWKTSYGWVVLSKMLLFYFLVLLWAFNRFISVPILQHVSSTRLEGPGAAGKMMEVLLARFRHQVTGPISLIFGRIVLAEAILLALVFFGAAVLKHQAPPTAAKEDIKLEEQEKAYQIRFP
jgi:putative copper export protein